MKFLSDLFAHPSTLVSERQAQITRIFGHLSWISNAILLAIALVLVVASPGQDALYDAMLQARIGLFRVVMGAGLILVGYHAALFIYNALENTETGKRLIVPDEKDFSGLYTIKVSNGGTVFGFLLIACIAGLLLSVLR